MKMSSSESVELDRSRQSCPRQSRRPHRRPPRPPHLRIRRLQIQRLPHSPALYARLPVRIYLLAGRNTKVSNRIFVRVLCAQTKDLSKKKESGLSINCFVNKKQLGTYFSKNWNFSRFIQFLGNQKVISKIIEIPGYSVELYELSGHWRIAGISVNN